MGQSCSEEGICCAVNYWYILLSALLRKARCRPQTDDYTGMTWTSPGPSGPCAHLPGRLGGLRMGVPWEHAPKNSVGLILIIQDWRIDGSGENYVSLHSCNQNGGFVTVKSERHKQQQSSGAALNRSLKA